MAADSSDVRFTPKSGHCPTQALTKLSRRYNGSRWSMDGCASRSNLEARLRFARGVREPPGKATATILPQRARLLIGHPLGADPLISLRSLGECAHLLASRRICSSVNLEMPNGDSAAHKPHQGDK
jgi:hypothetical protein